MSYDPFDNELQLMPVTSEADGMSRGRRWFNQVVTHYANARARSKPHWVHLPDRVWQRQSALLVSLHERKRHN